MNSGKVMVVTGGGRGIGAAISRSASRHHYRVCVNYRSDGSTADKLVTALREEGADAIAVQADVSQHDEVRRLFAAVEDHFGRLDVLVNNAAIVGGVNDVCAVEAADLERIFAINVFSQFYCAAEAIRRMALSRGGAGGVIVNMSSVSARLGGLPRETQYAATKGAIDSYTIALAREVGSDGIRVNAIRPGLVETSIHDAHGGADTLRLLAPSIPLGRVGAPLEIAEAVLWLASDAASYVHGAIIDVSGGR